MLMHNILVAAACVVGACVGASIPLGVALLFGWLD